MKATLLDLNNRRFSLTGECPYCRALALFMPVTGPHAEATDTRDQYLIYSILQCQGCQKNILGVVRQQNGPWAYIEHHPVGKPDDRVSDDIPKEIAPDFQEALWCRWIKSYRATVLMCRRSLQASCDREKAEGKDLFSQIDDLASKQQITEPLKKMAHKIRLLGKQGAHGDYSDIDATITEKDADDAIKFMRHYFEHVYELPKRLEV